MGTATPVRSTGVKDLVNTQSLVKPQKRKHHPISDNTLIPGLYKRLLPEHVILLKKGETVLVAATSDGDDDLYHAAYEDQRKYVAAKRLEDSTKIFVQGGKQILMTEIEIISEFSFYKRSSGEFQKAVDRNEGIVVGYKTNSGGGETELVTFSSILNGTVQIWTTGYRRIPHFLGLVSTDCRSIVPLIPLFAYVLDQCEGDVNLVIAVSEAIFRIRSRKRDTRRKQSSGESKENNTLTRGGLEHILLKKWNKVGQAGCPVLKLDAAYKAIKSQINNGYTALDNPYWTSEEYHEIIEEVISTYPILFATTVGYLPVRFTRRVPEENHRCPYLQH